MWNIVSSCLVVHKNATQAGEKKKKKCFEEKDPKVCFTIFKHQEYAVYAGFTLQLSTKKDMSLIMNPF